MRVYYYKHVNRQNNYKLVNAVVKINKRLKKEKVEKKPMISKSRFRYGYRSRQFLTTLFLLQRLKSPLGEKKRSNLPKMYSQRTCLIRYPRKQSNTYPKKTDCTLLLSPDA